MKISTIIISGLILAGCYALLPPAFKREVPLTEKAESQAPRPMPMPAPIPRISDAMPERAIKENKPIVKKNTVNKDEVAKQLFTASMAFTAPDNANIKETVKAQLLINPTADLDALEKQLSVKGNKSSQRIKVSKIIIANISAPNFEVDNVTPEEQAITQDDTTEWLWNLTPKSTGLHTVDLSVTAVVKVDNDSTTHHIRTFTKSVKIEITPKQVMSNWFDKYWQWSFTTLILPLVLWYYKKKKKD